MRTTEPHTAVRRFLQAHPAPEGTTLIAAVSGGADSLTLLFTLAGLRAELGFNLCAATLHHGMRAEADADVAMLQRLCEGLGVPLDVGRADVPGIAACRRISLEVAGREARYAFLFRTARDHAAHAICTGHTLDDQAETVLLRVIAGTGPEGLSGISPARLAEPPESFAPVWLWRPLLAVSRAATEQFCAARGLSPVRDPANADPRYPRNRVRHDLLPRLERDYNPAIREALARLADLSRAEDEVLAALSGGALDMQALAAGGARLHRAALVALPLGVRRRVARAFLKLAGATGRALGYENVERLLEAVERGGGRCHLDGALELTCDAEHATLVPIRPPAKPEPFEAIIPVPGTVALPGCLLIAELLPGNTPPSAGPWEAWLDADLLDAPNVPLVARSRRAGDRMRPLGLGGSRKVSDILTDRKVPRAVRDLLPVVESGGRIAWLAGVAASEEFRVTERTRRIVHLRIAPALFATSLAGKHKS